jgi:hypothetical protein
VIVDCPYCKGDEFGCCVCDHTGKVDTSIVGVPVDNDEQPTKGRSDEDYDCGG